MGKAKIVPRRVARKAAQKAKAPKKVVVPASKLKWAHKVYYRATQVGGCLPCYGIKPKKGLRLAMFFPHSMFTGAIPKEEFYIGTITKVWDGSDDPIITITFDGCPGCESWSGGWSQWNRFMIPYAAPPNAQALIDATQRGER